MNILYVTGITPPIEAVLRGESGIQGLPPFYYPWKMLVDKGHTVDFVMTSNFNEPYNIKVNWFEKKNIIKNIYAPRKENGKFRIFRQIKRFVQLIYYTNKAVKQKHYDFIYCKAFEGVAGQIIANIYHIPNGVRSFGDHMYLEIKKVGAKRTAIKHPLEYLCYRLNSDFILMSEDHKDQALTYNLWHNKRYNVPFYLWPSGIEFKPLETLSTDVKIPDGEYIFFAARLDPSKRQDRVIETLRELHLVGKKIHLYFCGSESSSEWRKRLERLVEKYELTNYVHFLGAVSQDTLKILAYNAIANILMIDGSSRNNVFYEIMSVGAVVVGLDDGGINDYITDKKSGYLVKSEKEAAETVVYLLENPYERECCHIAAREEAKKKIMSLDERFGREVKLIEDVAIKRK
jgi:glycosyltransferase involved in cell wall biosynthesis